MAEIVAQEVSGEVQSPTVAGIIEALSHISENLDMKAEKLDKIKLSPVLGLNPEDPRRIYQAPGGSRIWISYPEPIIYLNGTPIFGGQYQYTIDYIGGSVTFNGDFRPNPEDAISASFTHIISAPSHFVGCELKISFSPAFSGMQFTVTGSSGESYSDVVPASLIAYINVKNTNTEYTITAYDASGKSHTASVTTGQYYGQYEASVDAFSASITVTTVSGANITVKDSFQSTYTKVSGEDGNATFYVSSAGDYTITSEYNGVNSDTKVVNVSEDGGVYNATLTFITLLVTVESGSLVQVKNGLTTISDTSDGSVLFYLTNTGIWTVNASKGESSAETSVNVSSYSRYTVELTYKDPVSEVLNENDWSVINEISGAGEGQNWWDVGDVKNIRLNGTVGTFNFTNIEISVFIIGFNHNDSIEGSNKTHFAIGKISGKQIALCDNNYGSMVNSGFCMNTSMSNSGGWSESYMRKTVLGNSGYPNSPPSNSLLAALPYDLRLVLQPITKYTDNYGNAVSSSGAVTATTDYLWLFSEFEVYGTRTYANQYEKNKQKQYDYFKSGNSKQFYKHNSTGTGADVHSRSPNYDLNDSFVVISENGSPDLTFANFSEGLFSGFSV